MRVTPRALLQDPLEVIVHLAWVNMSHRVCHGNGPVM